jgi:tRNA wybutosine-synthesizing protein 4
VDSPANLSVQEPIITFKRWSEISSSSQPLSTTIARFGASVVSHQNQTWIVGGIVKNEILKESTEVCLVDSQAKVSQAVLSRSSSAVPRPLLIGSSVVSTEASLLVMGGSAVCFSFGTFWNTGCYALQIVDGQGEGRAQSPAESPNCPWRFSHTVAAASAGLPAGMPPPRSVNTIISVPRMRIGSSSDFDHILRSAKPIILEGLNLGQCTDVWTSRYLKERIGAGREVSFTSLVYCMSKIQLSNIHRLWSTKPQENI